MIESINKGIQVLKERIGIKEVSWDANEWKEIKVQSTVDEGKGLRDIDRKIHVYNQIKGL